MYIELPNGQILRSFSSIFLTIVFCRWTTMALAVSQSILLVRMYECLFVCARALMRINKLRVRVREGQANRRCADYITTNT